MRRARAASAAWLLVLSVAEAVTVSAVGKVTANFYSIYIRKDADAFTSNLLRSLALYCVVIALTSATFLLGQLLAVRWRQRLTLDLHERYFRDDMFFHISNQSPQQHRPAAPPDAASSGRKSRESSTPANPDNPDQRMTDDVQRFCQALAAMMRSVAKTPFELVQYSWLACSLFGSAAPLLVALGTFLVGAWLHRAIAAWVADCIYRQEGLEGELRSAHMRVRALALPIAALCAADAERAAVSERLAEVLRNQRRLAQLSALQYGLQKVTDYSGAIVSFVVMGAAVFHGGFGHSSGGDPGQDAAHAANLISLGAFYVMMLIHSLTSVLDASQLMAEVAGHAARISHFLARLDRLAGEVAGEQRDFPDPTELSPLLRLIRSPGVFVYDSPAGLEDVVILDGRAGDRDATDGAATRRARGGPLPWLRGGAGGASRAAELDAMAERAAVKDYRGARLSDKFREQAEELLPPCCALLPSGDRMYMSIHSVGDQELRAEVQNVFPDLPPGAMVLCVVTFQPLPPSCLEDSNLSDEQMDRLLDLYLAWERSVRGALAGHGFWTDSIDPRTGKALHSRQGASYSEAVGAQVFLGYEVDDSGVCPIALHPEFGRHSYPVSCFTTAPYAQLRLAISAACAMTSARRSPPHCAPLLHISGLTIPAPLGHRLAAASAAAALAVDADTEVFATPADWDRTPRSAAGLPTSSSAPLLDQLREVGKAADREPSGCSSRALRARDVPGSCHSFRRANTSHGVICGDARELLLPPAYADSPSTPLRLDQFSPASAGALAAPAEGDHGNDATTLVEGLTLAICKGQHTLIQGPSGSGKTTLLNALRGLVPVRCGSVSWALGATAMYVPQAVLGAPRGSLAQQLTYPDTKRRGDEYLRALLARVGAGHLAARCPRGDLHAPLGSYLSAPFSVGEMQRLAVARVLHARPSVVFLDEATSALPAEDERGLLGALVESGVTLVTVSHHDALRTMHARICTLTPGAGVGWRLEEV